MKTKLIYFRTPKTASSTIVSTIRPSNYTWLYFKGDIPYDGSFEEPLDCPRNYKNSDFFLIADDTKITYNKIIKTLDSDCIIKAFGVCRDPYSKFISSVNYCKLSEEKINEIISLDNITRESCKLSHHDFVHIFIPQSELIPNVVNLEVLRYEEFPNCADDFFQNNGFDLKITKYLKKTEKPITLSSEYIEFVNKHFIDDFERFNYKIKT